MILGERPKGPPDLSLDLGRVGLRQQQDEVYDGPVLDDRSLQLLVVSRDLREGQYRLRLHVCRMSLSKVGQFHQRADATHASNAVLVGAVFERQHGDCGRRVSLTGLVTRLQQHQQRSDDSRLGDHILPLSRGDSRERRCRLRLRFSIHDSEQRNQLGYTTKLVDLRLVGLVVTRELSDGVRCCLLSLSLAEEPNEQRQCAHFGDCVSSHRTRLGKPRK